MLYTSRFSNPELKSGKYTPVRISLGAPKWPLGYEIKGEIKDLMPFGLLQINDKALYEQKYRERLDRIGINRIQRQLDAFGFDKPVVLLCYEDVRDPSQWCHRTMLAEWLLKQTGEIVEELPDPSTVKLKNKSADVASMNRAPLSTPSSSKAEKAVTQRQAEQMQVSMFDNGRW